MWGSTLLKMDTLSLAAAAAAAAEKMMEKLSPICCFSYYGFYQFLFRAQAHGT